MKKTISAVLLAMFTAGAMFFGFTATADESADVGITLPPGFKATIFADDVGYVRHIAVAEDGTLYGIMYRAEEGGSLVALRDSDGDGTADKTTYFGDITGTGIGIDGGYLYFSSNTEIFRVALGDDGPSNSVVESVIAGFPEQRGHAAKSFALDGNGHIYVNVGGPSNICGREPDDITTPEADPCPQLEWQASIWRFNSGRTGQDFKADGHRYMSGVRNAMGIAWNRDVDELYFTTHGRDSLHQNFGQYYSQEDGAQLPAEEFHRASDGGNLGWPYTYWDHRRGARMVGPEYGGDSKTVVEPGKYQDPIIGFPGHWAPNGLAFYTGDAFPESYQSGAYIAFHGSWNRAPEPQEGYRVVFVPFSDGMPSGAWTTFADGFKGADVLASPGDAKYRPTGLAVGPDGALYIGADVGRRIWRVTYEGE